MSPRTLAATALAAAVLATGCGVPLDDEPRALDASTTTVEGPAQDTTDASGDSTAFLFFVVDNRLVNLAEEIAERNVDDALAVLFEGVPFGTQEEVVSQIPAGTRLLGVERTGSLLAVDVSADFDDVVGTVRTQAAAQIVMTATDIPGVDQVALRIDGQPTQIFSPSRGDSDSVGPCDYLGLLPTDDLIEPLPIDRAAKRHLTTRRNMLVAQCTPSGSNEN